MLKQLFHRIVAKPRIYDLVQLLAGAKTVRRHLAVQLTAAVDVVRASAANPTSAPSRVLIVDFGGGTGGGREALHPSRSSPCYVLLDIDPIKVAGYLKKNPGQKAIVADATCTPLAPASVDVVLCALVAHHLPDDLLDRFVREAGRVLKPAGRLIFVDPVWKPHRWPSRLLWRYDRGAFPRSADELRSAIANHLHLLHAGAFSVIHQYAIYVAEPAAHPRPSHRSPSNSNSVDK